jgi:hypothetical protein
MDAAWSLATFGILAGSVSSTVTVEPLGIPFVERVAAMISLMFMIIE